MTARRLKLTDTQNRRISRSSFRLFGKFGWFHSGLQQAPLLVKYRCGTQCRVGSICRRPSKMLSQHVRNFNCKSNFVVAHCRERAAGSNITACAQQSDGSRFSAPRVQRRDVADCALKSTIQIFDGLIPIRESGHT